MRGIGGDEGEMGVSTSQRPSRPITDELRQTVVEDLPEVSLIQNEDLRNKVVEAWAHALAESSFDRVTSLPAEGNPCVFRMKRGTQADHLRGVTRVAMAIADEFQTAFPETDIDRDVVIAGGLVHDVGKPWEFDPVNRDKWTGDPSRAGLPSLRHPVYGIHVCFAVGLPEEVIHIVLAHSYEGDFPKSPTHCGGILRSPQHNKAAKGVPRTSHCADRNSGLSQNIAIRPPSTTRS
jgi:putative nucleotidyltransferase with HDIG domain